VKVACRWRYVYRAIDQYGQIVDVYVSARRDTAAPRQFFVTALRAHTEPSEVVTDRAWTLRAVVEEVLPTAFHNTEQYANNRIETDHGRLKSDWGRCADSRPIAAPARSWPVTRSCRTCGEATTNSASRPAHKRVMSAFTELTRTI
jgi:transposase-like protein